MRQTTNSMRVRKLHDAWDKKEDITIGSLCYWLELLILVQGSTEYYDESARRDAFETLLSGIKCYGNSEDKDKYSGMQRRSWTYELEKEGLERILERLSTGCDHSEKRAVFAWGHFLNGCEYALQENLDPNTNDKVEKLLEILEHKLSNE